MPLNVVSEEGEKRRLIATQVGVNPLDNFTPNEAHAYIDAQVTTLATAKIVMHKIVDALYSLKAEFEELKANQVVNGG